MRTDLERLLSEHRKEEYREPMGLPGAMFWVLYIGSLVVFGAIFVAR